MTKEDVVKVMAILRGTYPSFYRDMTRMDADATLAIWQDMLIDYDISIVSAAVKRLIATRVEGYPPTIGAIIDEIDKIRAPINDRMTEQEAWTIVRKALSNGLYGSQKEYDKLPKTIQKVLGNASTIRDWAQADDVDTVIASNFMRSYRQQTAAETEMRRIPPSIQEQIDAVAGKLRIASPDDFQRISTPKNQKPQLPDAFCTNDAYGRSTDADCKPQKNVTTDFLDRMHSIAQKAISDADAYETAAIG